MKAKNVRRAIWLSLPLVILLGFSTVTFWPASSAKNNINAGSGNASSTQNPTVTVQVSPAAAQALAKLQTVSSSQIVSHGSRATGVYDFVRADSGGILAAGSLLSSPETRARAFLSVHGALIGMSDLERSLVATNATGLTATASTLSVAKILTDNIGNTHVRFNQKYKGLPVFGAQIVVHMNAQGITALNGHFVPAIKVGATPRISAAQAAETAKRLQIPPDGPLTVINNELSIYREGLLEGYQGRSLLAHNVEVTDGTVTREQVWIDAIKGTVVNRISLIHKGLDRIIYTPQYGEPFDVRHEGEPYTPGPGPGTTGAEPINNLYSFAGQTYNLFRSGFNRDAYDGAGHTMHSVLLANQNCPNAYWNGVSTNYCPDFDADDVVSHEWTHAYTEYTHGLIYAYQSGALNESYSDIFGETLDLINGVDAEGGSDNSQPAPNGQRWLIGEDVNGLNQPILGILRDMWTPTDFSDPDKVSSPNYACGSGDGGGVHTNSGVPNHAFAMLVDGKTFNGHTVTGIGFNRALAIYYRAMTVYQTPTTDFAAHAAALQASCNDLINSTPNLVQTGSPNGTSSGETITATTCQQVDNAMLAVEMVDPPACPVTVVLDSVTPAVCPGSADIFTENWEDQNMSGWTKNSAGTFPEWEDTTRNLRDFALTSTLPAGHSGWVAYAKAPAVGQPGGGGCTPGVDDYSGQFSIDSPLMTIPAGAGDVKLSFEHYLASETGVDGGQVELSINGGLFQLVDPSNYNYNRPNSAFNAPPPAGNNTNPNPGEAAWTGTNVPPGSPPSNWGTTIIDLSALTNPGDTVRIRFNWSQDGCNGIDGWYVDNIRVYSCAGLEAPGLSLGGDYQNPDPDGTYTLNWNRPVGATGPEVLQESSVCGPLLMSDGSSLAGWTAAADNIFSATWQTSNAKPQHAPNSAFWAAPNEQGFDSATLTYNSPIQIPSTGTTTLRFLEWYFNEDDDRAFVEISTDNGASWTAIHTNARGMGDLPDTGANAFANQPLEPRQFDLTVYGGKTIRFRFRYFQGQSDFVFFVQYGWYIDDISITNDSFVDIATVPHNQSASYTVAGRTAGTRCYRVLTNYDFGSGLVPSPYSNEVTAVSSLVQCLTNFAHSSLGSIATASSTYSTRNYSPEGAINGEVAGVGWEQGGGWNDATRDVWPDELVVNFNNSRSIKEIRVYTVQNDFRNPVNPTPSTPADLYGILDFDVEYWNGSAWVTVPGGSIRGNDKAMTVVTLSSPITMTSIRVKVLAGRQYYSRIVEVEALGCP